MQFHLYTSPPQSVDHLHIKCWQSAVVEHLCTSLQVGEASFCSCEEQYNSSQCSQLVSTKSQRSPIVIALDVLPIAIILWDIPNDNNERDHLVGRLTTPPPSYHDDDHTWRKTLTLARVFHSVAASEAWTSSECCLKCSLSSTSTLCRWWCTCSRVQCWPRPSWSWSVCPMAAPRGGWAGSDCSSCSPLTCQHSTSISGGSKGGEFQGWTFLL